MKNTEMIKMKYTFKKLFSKGELYKSEFLYMYVLNNNKPKNGLAVAVTKKQGKAVNRNHFKRLVKENYKNFEDSLRLGYDILFIINKEKYKEDINFYDIKSSMKEVLEKSGIIDEKVIN